MLGPGAFQLALQGYRFLETIGQGTYGVVKRARHSATGSYVAIKVLSESNSSSCRSSTHEASLLRSLRHEHIVHLIEVRLRRKHTFLIMELATKGSLLRYVQDKGGLGEAETRRLFKQILSAIQYCHGQRVAHRDLKLDNILLDAHWNAKLADFGLSSRLEEGELVTGFCGTPEYCAPEIFLHKPYDAFKADMWSVGVLLFTMITATLPFQDRHSGQLRNDILSGCHSMLQRTSSRALRELVSWLLRVVAWQRPTADMAWNHEWFGSCRQVTSRQDHVPQVRSVVVPQDAEAGHYQMGLDLLPGSRLAKRSPRALFQQPTSEPSGQDTGSLSSASNSLEGGCSSSGHQNSGQHGRGACSLLGSHFLPGPQGLQEPVPRAYPGTHKWVLLHLPEEKDGKKEEGKKEEGKEDESGYTCSQSQDCREEDRSECSPPGPQAPLGPQGLQEPVPKVPSGAFKWVLLHLPEEQDKKFLSLGYIPKLILMTSACLPSAQRPEDCTETEPTASGPQQSGSKSTFTTTTTAATAAKPTATTTAAKATTIIPKSKSATTANKSIAASNTTSTTITAKCAATATTAAKAATASIATTTSTKAKTTIAPATIPKSATTATGFTATTKSATRTTTSTTSVAAAASTAKPTATTAAAKTSTIPKSAAITTKFITTTKSITTITTKFTATTATSVATITTPPTTTTTEVTTTARSATATTTAEATTNTVTAMSAKSTITTATAKAATTTIAAARTTTPSTASTAKATATTAVAAQQPGPRTATSATREEKQGLRGIRRRISRFFLRAFCVLPAPKRSAGLHDRKVAPQ